MIAVLSGLVRKSLFQNQHKSPLHWLMNDGRRSIDRRWHRESVKARRPQHAHGRINSERLLPITSRHCLHLKEIIELDATVNKLRYFVPVLDAWELPSCISEFLTSLFQSRKCSRSYLSVSFVIWIYFRGSIPQTHAKKAGEGRGGEGKFHISILRCKVRPCWHACHIRFI